MWRFHWGMKAHLRRDKTSPYLSEATSQGLCQMAHIEEMEHPPPPPTPLPLKWL